MTWSFLGQLPTDTPNDVAFTAVTVAPGSGETIQIILLGTDGNLYLIWADAQIHVGDNDLLSIFFWYGQLQPAGIPQSQVFSAICAATGADGNVQLIASGALFLFWQGQDGEWNWYGQLPVIGNISGLGGGET
jgi:hypothetical protein